MQPKNNQGRGRPKLTPATIDDYLDKTAELHNGYGSAAIRKFIASGRRAHSIMLDLGLSNWGQVRKYIDLLKQKDTDNENESPQ